MKVLGMDILRLVHLPTQALRSSYARHRPFKATIAATYQCPYNCYYCGVFKRKSELLSPTDLAASLAPLKSLTWVDLTGGELFTRDDFLEVGVRLVEALPQLSLLHFPTSGAYPDAAVELARAVVARGVRVVASVSIEGPESLHDRVRGKQGAFAAALETFSRLKNEPGVSTYCGTTLINENIALVPRQVFGALAGHYPALRRGDMHFNVMQQSDHYFKNQSAPRPSSGEVLAALKRIIHWKGLPRTPFDGLELAFRIQALRAAARGLAATPACAALNSSFFMAPDGSVYPCHIWGEPIGRVGPGMTVADLAQDRRWQWLRTTVGYRQCPLCWTPCEAYPTLIRRLARPLG